MSRTILTREEILRIPELVAEGKTYEEIGGVLNKHKSSISYWVRKLKKEGIKVNAKHGPKPIKLNLN